MQKRIVTVRIGKPPKHGFARVHPNEEMSTILAAIDLKDDNELYFVTQNMFEALGGYISRMRLFTGIDTQGNVFLWSVKEPQDGHSGDWFDSAIEAVNIAREQWVQIKWNWATKAYDVLIPQGKLPEPKWPPGLALDNLLKIATRDKIIKSMDHTVVRRLLGMGN